MRILGLDIGSTAIRAVEVESAFGRAEIREYHEIPLEAGAPPNESLDAFVRSLPRQPDRVVSILPTSQSTFRNLTLPTRDRKAIASTVQFELEDDLPFSLDETVFDWSILRQESSGSDVHVAIAQTETLEKALEPLRSTAADPDVLTTEPWALRAFFNRWISQTAGLQANELVMAVLIGSTRTLVYGQRNGIPLICREISWGGADLTIPIAARYERTYEEAEQIKLESAYLLSEADAAAATPEQRELSGCLDKPVAELIQNLRQAELALKALARTEPTRVYVGGGTSLLPGLLPALEQGLGIPVQPVRALTGVLSSGGAAQYSEAADARFVLAVGAALCLVGPQRSLLVNFRKGPHVKAGGASQFSWARLKRPVLGATSVGLSLLLSLLIQSSIYRSRLKDTDAQLEKAIKSFFPAISSSGVRNYLSRPSDLRNALRKELDKQRELNRLFGVNPKSPVGFLKEVSKTIGKDTVVDLLRFQVGAAPAAPYNPTEPSPASLTFAVSNPQVAEKLAASLASKIPGLQKSKIEEIELPTDVAAPGGAVQKRWKITFSGNPSEDSYGNSGH